MIKFFNYLKIIYKALEEMSICEICPSDKNPYDYIAKRK
jgi:hypothetical protein